MHWHLPIHKLYAVRIWIVWNNRATDTLPLEFKASERAGAGDQGRSAGTMEDGTVSDLYIQT